MKQIKFEKLNGKTYCLIKKEKDNAFRALNMGPLAHYLFGEHHAWYRAV
jgi:hypothetical protein